MAKKWMFSQQIVETDKFVEMPPTAQLLYFHLGVYANGDGFVNNPRSIMRGIGARNDDFALLCTKGYIIQHESGISLNSQ